MCFWYHLILFQVYDANIALVNPKDTLRKGDSAAFLVTAYVTEPTSDLEFSVFQPLGYNVRFQNKSFTEKSSY